MNNDFNFKLFNWWVTYLEMLRNVSFLIELFLIIL
jgi:hypothetical protein